MRSSTEYLGEICHDKAGLPCTYTHVSRFPEAVNGLVRAHKFSLIRHDQRLLTAWLLSHPVSFSDSLRYKGVVISYTSSFPSLILTRSFQHPFLGETTDIPRNDKLPTSSLRNHQHHQSQHRILHNLIVSSTNCQPRLRPSLTI